MAQSKVNPYYTIEIRKPLWENENGSWVCIYDRHIKEAIRNKQFIQIITPHDTAVYMPKEWKKMAKRMKKVFLIPNHPMNLLCGYIKSPKKKTYEEEIEYLAKLGVFGG